jgi:hypothetical protein
MDTVNGTVIYYDSDGSELGRSAFYDLATGDTVMTSYTVGGKFAAASGGVVRASVETDVEELYDYNNSDSAYVEAASPGIVGFAAGDREMGACVLMASGTKGHALCAFYDASGKMLSVKSADLKSGLNDGLSFPKNSRAATAKLFVIVDGGKPLFDAGVVKMW